MQMYLSIYTHMYTYTYTCISYMHIMRHIDGEEDGQGGLQIPPTRRVRLQGRRPEP